MRFWFVWLIFVAHVVTGDGGRNTGSTRRRRAAEGITKKIRIVTLQNLPYTNITQSDNGLRFIGFIPDLIYLLSKKLHFDYEFYQSPDGKYGTEQEDGTWNGMIGELLLNKHDPDGNVSLSNDFTRPGADIVAAALTVTSKRQTVVDFVHPFHNLGLTILIQKAYLTDNGTDLWPFDFGILKPLSAAVWGMVFLAGIVVASLLCALNYLNPYEWGGRYNIGLADAHQKDSFCLSGAFWFVFSTLQWQGFERAPRAVSSKILTCFWFAFVTLTLVTYIGGLINNLWWSTMAFSRNPLGHPITDLEDLVAGAGMDFKYGAISDGATYDYVMDVASKQKAEFRMMKHYWETQEGKEQLVGNLQEALHKLRTEKYAFIVETMTARWEANQKPCDLTTVGPQFALRSYGLAVPINWPYLDLFHRGVMELNEEGVIDELEEKWWEDRGECWNEKISEKALRKANAIYLSQAKPKVVDLHMFWSQLVLMVLGIVITLITAAVEILYYRYKGKYMTSNRPRDQSLKLENEDGTI